MRNTKLPGPDLKQRLKSGYSKSYLSFRGSFWFWLCCSFRGIMAASYGIKRCSAGFRSQSVSVPRPVRAEHWRPQWGTNLNQTRAGDMQSGSYQTLLYRQAAWPQSTGVTRGFPTEPLRQAFITDYFSSCFLISHTLHLPLHGSKDSGSFQSAHLGLI